jgi:hypothetical protein
MCRRSAPVPNRMPVTHDSDACCDRRTLNDRERKRKAYAEDQSATSSTTSSAQSAVASSGRLTARARMHDGESEQKKSSAMPSRT